MEKREGKEEEGKPKGRREGGNGRGREGVSPRMKILATALDRGDSNKLSCES